MRNVILFCLFLSLFSVINSVVVETNELDLLDHLNNNKVNVVLIKGVKCEDRCRRMSKALTNVTKMYRSRDDIVFVSLSVNEHTSLKNVFRFTETPFLFISTRNSIRVYDDNITTSSIAYWVSSYSMSQVKNLKNEKQLQSYKKLKVKFIINTNETASDLYQAYAKASSVEFEKSKFYRVANTELLSEVGYVESNQIVAFRNFEPERVVFTGEPTVQNVLSFIRQSRRQTVMKLTPRAESAMKEFNTISCVLIRNANSTDEESNQMERVVRDFARINGGKVLVTVGNENGTTSSNLQEAFGIQIDSIPAIRFTWQKADGLKKYNFEERVTAENLDYFVERMQKNLVRPYTISQRVPKKQSGNTRRVVGKNFEKEVLENDLDVLVNFYASWDKNSTVFGKTYETLATTLVENKNLVLAKVDTTQNEVDGILVDESPSLFLYKRGDKQNPIRFTEEDMTSENILKFLKQNVGNVWRDVKGDL